MAKISLSKLTPIKKLDAKSITINEQEIVIQQYLPVETKMQFMQDVLTATIDDTGHVNPVRLEVFFNMYLIKYYTNISITDTMLSDPSKTYDLLSLNNIFNQVIENIPAEEYEDAFNFIIEACDNVVKYNNSVLGIIRNIVADYKNTEMNIDKISNTLNDPGQLTLVKNILEKLG